MSMITNPPGVMSPAAIEVGLENGDLPRGTRAARLEQLAEDHRKVFGEPDHEAYEIGTPPENIVGVDNWTPPLVNAEETTVLRGEQHAAHVALQTAARDARDAQQALTTAQAKLHAAMQRWLRANGPEGI